ncbi:putative ATP-dependent helicase [Exophiala dermatitidis]
MAALDEPAPKRRRITHEPDDLYTSRPPPPPPPFHSYLVIAETRLIANDSEADRLDINFSGSEPLAITIYDAEAQDQHYKIAFSVGRNTRWKYHLYVKALSSGSGDILQDATRLESVAKYKAPAALPLACAYASIHPSSTGLCVDVSILWENTTNIRDRIDPRLLDILGRYLPCDTVSAPAFKTWNPRQFYDNVHVPMKPYDNVHVPMKPRLGSADIIKIPYLESELFPFQRRAVRWLLKRECASLEYDGQVTTVYDDRGASMPRGFELLKTHRGQMCFVNHTLGVVSTNRSSVLQEFSSIRGGILAEEMGLGKTLEIIALICLHRKTRTIACAPGLRQSSATLIITPPSILEQWKQEIQEHAPALRVHHYQGLSSYRKKGDALIEELLDQDVVLTTYNVIAKEIHYVMEKPDRYLRTRPRVEPPKSPLTQIWWWRVCLDEAQMVESGVSSAATVARLIPRINAWAVTGTPLRSGHRDLHGLLLFLRYQPWSVSTRLWDYLVTYHRPLFRQMLQEIAMRHTKDYVREDLRLPPQSRHTITIPFTPIEEQHYAQLFQQMCDECELDRIGTPLAGDWDPNSPATIEKMRTWLTRLRQTCLHPEVGGRNRRALGRNTNGPLRTVDQVLEVMIDQHESQLRTAQRGKLMAMIRRGQLKENAKATEDALHIWRSVYDESVAIVQDCRKQLLEEEAFAANLKKEQEDEDEEEANPRLIAARLRLRNALEVQHIAIFFIANAHFQLKSLEDPESEKYQELEKRETAAYEEAKAIRGELLAEVQRHVNKAIGVVRTDVAKGLTQLPDMPEPEDDYTGIESRKLFDKVAAYCRAMNVQAQQFRDLRKKMADFLSRALIDEDEGVELQGDEYESSTKHQDEMYAYMEALRALVADRSEAISGQENMLIKQEMKQFLRAAKDGEGPAPELMLKLLADRQEKRVKVKEYGSLRGIIAEIRQLVISLQWQQGNGHDRAGHELEILERILKHVQQLGVGQTKAMNSLEQEVNQFRDTMNSRLDYYRALQKISDTVAPYQEENVGRPLSQKEYRAFETEEAKLQQKIVSLSGKLRYLLHMKTESKSAAPRICTICTDNFEVGTMTSCGHQFCKDCILTWWAQHRNCPVCKTPLHPNSFQDITYKPAEIAVQAESPSGSISPSNSGSGTTDRAHDQSIYSDISTGMLNQIKNVELRGPSFGSKIDFLCRHLLWLREHDPGCKSIIFSQYREFIDVLARAFDEHKISSTRIDAKNGIEKFKSDPTVECFLLHAKAHSTGLNLVVANHVFLCEPLINTAIELQAIARVHRIGQVRPTTVWMYLIADTVEEAIYDISVTRRLAHLKSHGKSSTNTEGGKNLTAEISGAAEPSASQFGSATGGTRTPNGGLQETAIDAANSMELQAADLSRLLTSGKNGGEMVDKEDLWACLFSKVKQREEVMGGGVSAAMASAAAAAAADAQPANSEIGRLLRLEAAQRRTDVNIL